MNTDVCICVHSHVYILFLCKSGFILHTTFLIWNFQVNIMQDYLMQLNVARIFLMAIIVAIVLAYLAPHPTTDSFFLEKVLYGSVIAAHSPGHRDGPVMGMGSTLYELGLFSMLVLTRTGRD